MSGLMNKLKMAKSLAVETPNCMNCHALNGVLNFRDVDYSAEETKKLTDQELCFRKMVGREQDEW